MSVIGTQAGRPSSVTVLAVTAALTIAAAYVFHGALGLYFAQEDFRGIAVAKGLLPRHQTLWRYLSVQGFMDLLYPVFGTDPKPYHAMSLGLHAVNAVLLFAMLSRQLAPAAAMLGTALFATHPSLFSAIYWLSARSDLLATFFGLGTVALALRVDAARWLAVPAFALALISKESVILLPIAVWFILRRQRREGGAMPTGRDTVLLAMLLLSAAFGLYLVVGKAAGIGIGAGREAAYALDFGKPLLQNLLTYVGWAADVAMLPSPLRFVDAPNPRVFALSAVVLIAWMLAGSISSLRSRGWLVAGLAFVLLLAPVLPLRNHTYHYFLYAPLAAVAWCLAIALNSFLSALQRPPRTVGSKRLGRRTTAGVPATSTTKLQVLVWTLASVGVVGLAWNGARLVHRMETRPMRVYPQLRGDPIVDRSLIAERTIEGLQQAGLPPGTELVFLLRERLALLGRIELGSGERPPPAEEVYPETNVRTALFEGHGVRALVPQVIEVTFSTNPEPVPATGRYVVYAPTGEVEVLTPAGLDSLLRSSWIARW